MVLISNESGLVCVESTKHKKFLKELESSLVPRENDWIGAGFQSQLVVEEQCLIDSKNGLGK